MTELVNLVIDRAIFFDVGIARWHIGFWLVVIVVRDEILDRIFREKFLELPIKLPSKCLIMSNDQGRFIDLGNDLAHGIGLPRTSRSHQDLGLLAPLDIIHQLLDGLRLIPRRLVFGDQFKFVVCYSINHLFVLTYIDLILP